MIALMPTISRIDGCGDTHSAVRGNLLLAAHHAIKPAYAPH
jgi:hypothetical protein